MWMALLLAPFLGGVLGDSEQPELAAKPNVVLIISDDQAWTDFGFLGHRDIRTPHIDRLASESIVFPRGYVPSSLCRPSLATLVSGLFPHEHGITGNDPPKGTPRDEMLRHIARIPALPRLLAERGYASLQTGKWWEGNCTCGGFSEGMTHGDPARGGRHGDVGLDIGRKTMEPIRSFFDRCGDQPFFLWYAPFLPHTPHNPPERLLERYRKQGRSIHVARYYAMCEWFDETVGELRGLLEERGKLDDTVVVFAVDNGWIQDPNSRRFAPRSKRSPYDGGVRTPILLRWPERWSPRVVDVPVSTVSIAPTILRACGAPVPAEMTGVDLGEVSVRADHGPVFGATFAHDVVHLDEPAHGLQFRWVVDGTWKLLIPSSGGSPSLFELGRDPFERIDLAPRESERVQRLRGLVDGWWPAEISED